MIDKSELKDFAREFGLEIRVVEKDYVLGWLLAGIFQHQMATGWVFKGGTCLKKCFFETYRFSEDLDFTIMESNQLDQEYLINSFKAIAEWIYNESGIEIPYNLIRFDVFENHRGGMAAQGRIAYRGPLQSKGDPPRIKLDLTNDEILVLDSVIRNVHHPYSDSPGNGIQMNCYRFEELFAEKIRALTERERPRDLYDVIHLFRQAGNILDNSSIWIALEKKCGFKGISTPTMETFGKSGHFDELKAEWENMLAHQLPALPSFEQFWEELPTVMEWLHKGVRKITKPVIPYGKMAIDDSWRPPSMISDWNTQTPIEKIRFAGANQLCVNIFHQDNYRLVEPYSLRRSKDGDILLFAVEHDSNTIFPFPIEGIKSAEVTDIPFVPRYSIELTPSNLIFSG
ncbi:MAG: nucleotidyl transferase AbiEii/AbiGii toxin family protein [Thermodesulfobacteriota bacterium]